LNDVFRQCSPRQKLLEVSNCGATGGAADIGAATWAQFILKFILAQPAVTVAIPATTRVDHVRENMAAASDPIPDDALRERMAAYVRDV
jgi:aryl-alcohol dehydrogenase-like predicted oxidoreductase